MLEQVAEGGAVATDAERVGQGQRDFASRGVGGGRGLAESRLRLGRVEEIALEVDDLRPSDEALVDVARMQPRGGAEEGTHGPLRVRRHEDEAAPGRRPFGGPRRLVAHARGSQIVAEYLAELIVAHLSHVLRAAAEGG